MRKMKFHISVVLVVALSVCLIPADKSMAATVKLSSKKLTIIVGKTKTLKLKNNKKKVKWTVTSGKKNVTLKNKKKTSVKIVGKKAGTAKIQAKIGKKKYVCKVTVKKNSSNAVTPQPTATSEQPATSTMSPVPTQEPMTTVSPFPTNTPDMSKLSIKKEYNDMIVENGCDKKTLCLALNQLRMSIINSDGSTDSLVGKVDTNGGLYLDKVEGLDVENNGQYDTTFTIWKAGETVEVKASVSVVSRKIKDDFIYLSNGSIAIVLAYTGMDSNITIPDEIDGADVINGDDIEYLNDDLEIESITLPKGTRYFNSFMCSYGSGSMGGLYPNVLKSINIAENATLFSSEQGVLFSKDKSTLIYYPRENQASEYTVPQGTVIIADYALRENPYIETIVIPESVTNIETYGIMQLSNLQEINVDDANKNYMSEGGVLYSKDKTVLRFYPYARSNERYEIPDGVKEIHVVVEVPRYLKTLIVHSGVEDTLEVVHYDENDTGCCLEQLYLDVEDYELLEGEGIWQTCYDIIYQYSGRNSLTIYVRSENQKKCVEEWAVYQEKKRQYANICIMLVSTTSPISTVSPVPQNTLVPDATILPTELPVEYLEDDAEQLQELIQMQRSNGATVSEDITDSEEYRWEDGRLLGIRWEDKGLTGILDVAHFSTLTELKCGNNELDSLKINGCMGLEYLDCDSNHLTELDITNCTVLEYLSCDDNQLCDLNVANCTVLGCLSCSGNQLERLDVSGCLSLTDLFCNNNQLDNLIVSNDSLKHLWCCDNNLNSLTVSAAGLSELNCQNNHLDYLDVSACTELTQLTYDDTVNVVGYVPKKQSDPKITYQAHVQEIGWMKTVSEGETAGTTGRSKRLEAFIINLDDIGVNGNIEYRAHVAEYGWQDWKTSGIMAGRTGKGQAIEAVQIKLTDELAVKYDIYYRLHVEEIGWLGWTKNGAIAGSTGLSIESQAIQIRLVRKDESFDTVRDATVKRPTITYQAYCQYKGWMDTVQENVMAGTVEKSLRLEALKINISGHNLKGSIQYRAHVAEYGWQDWKTSGETAGTTGQSRAIEAVQIQLTSELAAVFDVYYRVYSAEIGWLGWAKNGAYAGTTGGGLRAEAVQLVLVNKGSAFSVGAAAYRYYTSTVNSNTSGFTVRTNAPATNNAYFFSSVNSFYPELAPYPGTIDSKGNCTWYAFGRAYEILKCRPNLSIKAAPTWYSYNKSNGCYPYGTSPKVGAIVCWSNHVAVVEKINTDGTILISESSYNGYYPQGFLFQTRTVSAVNPNNYGDPFYGYIYII